MCAEDAALSALVCKAWADARHAEAPAIDQIPLQVKSSGVELSQVSWDR